MKPSFISLTVKWYRIYSVGRDSNYNTLLTTIITILHVLFVINNLNNNYTSCKTNKNTVINLPVKRTSDPQNFASGSLCSMIVCPRSFFSISFKSFNCNKFSCTQKEITDFKWSKTGQIQCRITENM